ncbi:MAG TPA: carotenoid biosynthesis protein [Candidatus Saccharimonadia bacterium]|jgi:putative membrane protein
MKLGQNAKWMYVLLIIAAVSGVLDVILRAAGLHSNKDYAASIVLVALACLLALHSKWQLGSRRAVSFFMLAALTGLFFEIWGLKSGTFFGGHYTYNGGQPKLWGVPYIIPIYWAIFIYTAYSITNGFRRWLDPQGPSEKSSSWTALLALIALDGVLTVAIDLIMDPVKIREGSWTWLDHGAYFGVPLGNFMGWFIVTVVVTGIFRLYEYCRPGKYYAEAYLLLIPAIGYGLIGLGFGVSAALYGMEVVAGLSALPILIAAADIILYLNRTHRVGLQRARLQ